MSAKKKPEIVIDAAAEAARMRGAAAAAPSAAEPMVDLDTVNNIPSPADSFPDEGFKLAFGVQEGERLSASNAGTVDEGAFAQAQARMQEVDGDDVLVDVSPELVVDGVELVRVSYQRATGRYFQYNPAHTNRTDFEIRRVKKVDLHKLNLVA